MLRAVLVALVASAPLATAENASQIHLSIAPHGYVVAFEMPGSGAPPNVSYRTTHGDASVVAQPATRDPRGIYIAQLPANATGYQIGSRAFDIHKPASPDNLTVVVIADMGRSADSWAVWSMAARQRPDVILMAGDISYANGDPAKWDDWFTNAETMAVNVPIMTALGNHETYCSPDGVALVSCANESLAYLARFRMPAQDQLYYDFALGPAHFTALDTEAYHPGPPDAPSAGKRAQTAFLDQSLQNGTGQWKIVYFHRPLYSSNVHEADVADPAAKADWQPILDARGASLVINGHAHAYERTYPLRADAVVGKTALVQDGNGIIYVTTGGGGRSLYSEFAGAPAWSAIRSAEFEFVVLNITRDHIVGKALRPDGSLLDTFAVYRGASPPTLEIVQQSDSPVKSRNVTDVAPLLALAAVGTLALTRRLRRM